MVGVGEKEGKRGWSMLYTVHQIEFMNHGAQSSGETNMAIAEPEEYRDYHAWTRKAL